MPARMHGLSHKIPEYDVWASLRDRCRNPRNRGYVNYGGRGIFVDPRWNDFMTFYNDMGPRPANKESIERRDNNGPYSPENCYWATRQEQNKNQRPRRAYFQRPRSLITINGRTRGVSQWSRELGLSRRTIWRHVKKGILLASPE